MNIEKLICEKVGMSESELEKLVKEEMENGARNRVSALNKIKRKNSEKDDGKEDVKGFFLQDYERKRGTGVSLFILKEDGSVVRMTVREGVPPPKEPMKIGDPVLLKDVVRKKNVFTDSTWLEVTEKTKIKPADMTKKFEECANRKLELPDEGGIVFMRATVNQVWGVSPFSEDGERGDALPILDRDGKVNLRFSISPHIDGLADTQMSVKIPDEDRLKLLVGDDIEWLNEEKAILEMADMFRNTDVLVFGRFDHKIGRGTADEKETRPFINITNFGFVIPIEG